ncbi:MAG: hypothetical protein Q8K59_02155 [Nitrosomonas sp.]|nr:hypothetical protein [Nitrosomonas sp.]MDP1949895.1 hypothetical protein [Nitrosomonas sp.]
MNKLFLQLKRLLSVKKSCQEIPSENTNNTLSILSQADHIFFANFCQFVWIQGEPLPLIYDVADEVYKRQGITLSTLKHLETICLLTFEPNGFVKKGFGKHTRLFYAGKPTKIEFASDIDNQLDLGHVLLTDTGKRMALACNAKRNQAFYEYVITRWFQQGYVLSSIQLNLESKKH